jgi:hypothetical protein
MTEERWRNVAIGLGVVFVALVVIVVATSLPSGTSSPTARPSLGSPVAGASGTPSASEGGATPSEAASAPASTSPSATPTPSASATVQPSAGLATITFTDFKLDATSDSSGKARTFTFKTDGPGNVKAKLSSKSPQGTTKFCLKVGGGKPVCRNFAAGTLTGTTTAKGKTTFVVSLIGVGIATPTVDLGLSFRANDPSVALTNGRFDGKSVAGYDGMRFRLRVRSGGSIATKATWGGKPFDYSYGLVDPTDPGGAKTFTGNATGIDRTDTVTPSRTWGGSLLNTESGFGRTPLTMTVSWH